ncbi:MAG TPA: ankyrin repeat domain-containing protein [Candidatus Acidoferrales bacterium]|nr:ankyrin repeat domain-containing protein [Candidatus Acidoferrales bacterium]
MINLQVLTLVSALTVFLSGCGENTTDKMVDAADKGDTNTIGVMIEKGARINARNTKGYTALEIASLNGNANVVRYLLEKNADCDLEDGNGNTALRVSVMLGHVDVVEMLLEKCANPNSNAFNGETPLMCAAHFQQLSVVKMLLARGVEINAVDYNGKTALEYAVDSPFRRDSDNDSPRIQIVNILLDHFAKVNGKLLFNSYYGHDTVIVEALLKHDIDVNVSGVLSRDPMLSDAVAIEDVEFVKILLDKGANVDIVNSRGMPPLMLCKNVRIIELLLSKHANINFQNAEGATSLIFAASAGWAEVVRTLIAHGANVNAKTKNGHTALYIARNASNAEIVQMLQKAGATE